MPPSYSRHAYFSELKFPDVDTIDVLNGKSNFRQWHSDIQPVLLSNPYSSDLILGSWSEPQSPPSWTVEDQASFDEERREWHAANIATCRFIRATLATNVCPFVRQYTTAKTLFFNLVWLYGEDAGIDTQGGPPVPANAENLNPKKGRAGLLAALEAKRTMEYLLPVCASLKPPASSARTHQNRQSDNEIRSSSAFDTEPPITRGKSMRWQPTVAPELSSNVRDEHVPTGRLLDPTCIPSHPSLETIHEHDDEPHPGRRVPSGYVIGFDDGVSRGYDQEQSGGSISPICASDSVSEYGDDDDEVRLLPASQRMTSPPLIVSTGISRTADLWHQEQDERPLEDDFDFDIAVGRSPSQRAKKRRAAGSPDGLEPRPAKAAGITSILKTVTANKGPRKRDKFTFSFPMRRLNPEKTKAKGGNGKARG